MAKILIFTSYGGGGHISASNAMTDYLKDIHEIVVIPIFAMPLSSLDPIRLLTLKKYNCEDAYNYFLRKRWIRLLNFVTKAALTSIPFIKKTLERTLVENVKSHNPDLIISVIPIVNSVLYEAAQQCNIPFSVIPTDLDTSTFIYGLKPDKKDDFFLGLPFDDTALLKIVKKISIPRDKVGITGFPLRRSFFESKNKTNLKKKFGIPQDKPVVLLLMGAVGSQAIEKYLSQMAQIKESFHIIVCLGRNESLRKTIDLISFFPQISLSIFGFTEHIADLMATADFCIAKPGSVSVCEAVYMNLPLILDGTSKSLLWEDFNLHFIKNHNFGTVITKTNQIQTVVGKYLKNPAHVEELKINLKAYKKVKFNEQIEPLVETMIKK